jgi:pectate lyase-like protein
MLRRLLARRWPLVVGSSVFIAPAALAADYYVSPQGSNSASGSLDAPFRTVRRGVEAAMPGDTVYVREGEYVGWENQINPVRAGRADAFITIRNFPGELPILLPYADQGEGAAFEPFDDPDDDFADAPIAFIRVQGFVAYQWPTTGFTNGFVKQSNDIEFRYNVADGNGVNGIAFYGGTGVRIENNIVAHNGNRAPSWSSGINLFSVLGAANVNVVRGNVSFENIDVCGANGCNAGQSTDGNGFILDEGAGGAVRFESNLAFRNGGSCLRLTLTPGGQLVNNTCYNNGLDTGYAFQFGEIFASDAQSRDNTLVRNNLAVGTNGQPALGNVQGANANVGGNVTTGVAASVFRDPDGVYPDFRLAGNPQNLINAADTSATGATDLGFDPRCVVRSESPIQGVSFWLYNVNYAYIRSVGGVEGCFRPVARASGGSADIGAYEAVSTGGCQFHNECDDGVACTQDRCGEQGQCSNTAVAGCCTTDVECDDGDACTVDSCNAGRCRSATNGVCSGGQTGTGGGLPPDVTVDLPGDMSTGGQTPPVTPTQPLPGTPGAGSTDTPGSPAGMGALLPAASGSSGGGGCALSVDPGRGVGTSLGVLLMGLVTLLRRRSVRRSRAALALGTALIATWGCGSDDDGGAPPAAFAGMPGNTSGTGGTASGVGDPSPAGGQPGNIDSMAPGAVNQPPPAATGTATAPATPPPAPVGTGAPSGPAQACARTPAPEGGLLIDFGTMDTTSGAWGVGASDSVSGGTSRYSCAENGSCPAAAALNLSTNDAGALRLQATLPGGGYTGAVLWFGPCVDASAFEGLRLLTSGNLSGSTLLVKVQTAQNYPVDVASGRGGCQYLHEDTKNSECQPAQVRIEALTSTPANIDLPWSRFSGGVPNAGVAPDGLLGLELQFQCTAQASCAIDVALGTTVLIRPSRLP